MHDYVPEDDGSEPIDCDVYYDIPGKTAKDVAFRVYVKIERDPRRAEALDMQQNEAIMDLLRWIYDNRAQLRAKGHTFPESWPE